MTGLAECLVAVHEAFESADIPHAFGGAIALGYCVAEPRATQDVDVNVFVKTAFARRVLAALPSDVAVGPTAATVLERDGQVRVRWGRTPIDLFLNTHEFHEGIAERVHRVPFAGFDIPVLDCVSLAVFKAFFNRGKDWIDIGSMVDAGLDVRAVVRWLEQLLGVDDPTTQRMAVFLS